MRLYFEGIRDELRDNAQKMGNANQMSDINKFNVANKIGFANLEDVFLTMVDQDNAARKQRAEL